MHKKFLTFVVFSLVFSVLPGCTEYAQDGGPANLRNVEVKPGQVFTAENGCRYNLIPGKLQEWGNEFPAPEVIYCPHPNFIPFKTGKRYVMIWDEAHKLLNKNPVYVYPGQPFTFNDDNVYLLTAGPLITVNDPNVELKIWHPNLRSEFIEGKKYALLPPPENSQNFILQSGQVSPQAQALQTQQPAYAQNNPPGEENMADAFGAFNGAFDPLNQFGRDMRRSMREEKRTVNQMNRDNKDILGILNGARQQDNMYRQQKGGN